MVVMVIVWNQQLYSHSVLQSFISSNTDNSLYPLQVSSLFKDGTIGGNINIVIVGLVLLDEEQVSTPQPGENFSFLRSFKIFSFGCPSYGLIIGHVLPQTRFRRENCVKIGGGIAWAWQRSENRQVSCPPMSEANRFHSSRGCNSKEECLKWQ